MPLLVRFRTFLAGVPVALFLFGCLEQPLPPVVEVNHEAVKSVAGASNTFAFDVYGAISDREGNLFFSPASISTALAMTSAGAAGETKEEMTAALHLADVKQPHVGFSALLALLNSRGERNGYILSTANRLWGAESYPFKDAFLELTRQRYRAELESLDFSNPEQARETINEWVAEQTHDKITDLIASGTLNARTRLVLTNAIYFKSGWDKEFEKDRTKPREFHLSAEESANVPTMFQRGEFSYASPHYQGTDYLEVLELPYEGGDLSMVIILPHDPSDLSTVEDLLTEKTFQEWTAGLDGDRLVDVYLPKFKLRQRLSLAGVLASLGMRDAFDAATANFSGISSEKGLFVSDVVHEAFVDVDEKGTEAAGATTVIAEAAAAPGGGHRNPPEPIIFRADHPFLFAIRDNRSGVILFLGRVMDPRR